MIELFPEQYNDFTCPRCKHSTDSNGKIIFQGIHLVAALHCTQCGLSFYHDFPTGHGIVYPAAIDGQTFQLYYPQGHSWFTTPLINSLKNPSDSDVRVTVNRQTNNASGIVILFNCLDAWYGHVLLKLFNLQFYHKKFPSYKKIVLIPKGFAWMVPEYTDEIWEADLKLGATTSYYTKLNDYIHASLFGVYEKVYYSSGYSHPPLQQMQSRDFFKTSPFAMESFNSNRPQITFIYREDRLWITPGLHRLFNFLKRKKNGLQRFFLNYQVRKINDLAKAIKAEIPDAKFIVCGLGSSGKFNADIDDQRATVLSPEKELEWCEIYAGSHIVVGIHGSNMLIPSALAGAWIEILPDDRITNITQDLFCKYEFNTMSFMGRFVSEYDPVGRIAKMVIGLLSSYRSFAIHQIHDFNIQKEKP